MRILLTNGSLAGRAGSELYILDVARELLRRGHQPICYSPILGEVADDLLAATIPVTDNLANIQLVPDVIHGQHHLETLAALLHFPSVPAIQYCHGWIPWEEAPVAFPRVRRYIAVSELNRQRLVTRHGIPEDLVRIVPNFFDENRFLARNQPLPARPERALLLSNAFDAQAAPVREACRRFGIALDVVGLAAGNVHTRLENLPQYPLVFSLGRGAIEAMACGAAVICLAEEGIGPLITPGNFDVLRSFNFGIRVVTGPLNPEAIAAQIELYDPAGAAEVSQRIRAEAKLGDTVARLLDLYSEAIASNQPSAPGEEARAVSAYLSIWSPRFKNWAHRAGQADRVLQDHAQRLEQNLMQARAGLEAAQSQLDEIRNSLAWRISTAILDFRPFHVLAGLFRRRTTPETAIEPPAAAAGKQASPPCSI